MWSAGPGGACVVKVREEVDGCEDDESGHGDGRDAEEEVAPSLRRSAGEKFHHGLANRIGITTVVRLETVWRSMRGCRIGG
jgi:hypothetical protein